MIPAPEDPPRPPTPRAPRIADGRAPRAALGRAAFDRRDTALRGVLRALRARAGRVTAGLSARRPQPPRVPSPPGGPRPSPPVPATPFLRSGIAPNVSERAVHDR